MLTNLAESWPASVSARDSSQWSSALSKEHQSGVGRHEQFAPSVAWLCSEKTSEPEGQEPRQTTRHIQTVNFMLCYFDIPVAHGCHTL